MGGTLSTSGAGVIEMAGGSLANATLQGTMRVTGGPWLTRDSSVIDGRTITNNGLIVFEPTASYGGLTIAHGQITIEGSGEIDMGASGKGRIGGTGPHQLTLGAGQLLRGSGELGASQIALVNHGTIRADRALNHLPGPHGTAADAAIVTTQSELSSMLKGPAEMLRALDAGEYDIQGNAALFRQFVQTLDSFEAMFNVVEP